MKKLIVILIAVLVVGAAFAGEKKQWFRLWRADDPRLANPINKFHPRNPLNPANRFRSDNDFNPINRFRPENPLNPVRKFDPKNLLNPINRFDSDSPLNPINKFRSSENPPRRERSDPFDLWKDEDVFEEDSFDLELDLIEDLDLDLDFDLDIDP